VRQVVNGLAAALGDAGSRCAFARSTGEVIRPDRTRRVRTTFNGLENAWSVFACRIGRLTCVKSNSFR
jgi:hypothetical protein